MNASQVIDELRKLPEPELEEVLRFLNGPDDEAGYRIAHERQQQMAEGTVTRMNKDEVFSQVRRNLG